MSEEKAKFKLCCGGRGCPEVVKIDDTLISITDDNGGTVILTKDEASFIGEAITKLWNT